MTALKMVARIFFNIPECISTIFRKASFRAESTCRRNFFLLLGNVVTLLCNCLKMYVTMMSRVEQQPVQVSVSAKVVEVNSLRTETKFVWFGMRSC